MAIIPGKTPTKYDIKLIVFLSTFFLIKVSFYSLYFNKNSLLTILKEIDWSIALITTPS